MLKRWTLLLGLAAASVSGTAAAAEPAVAGKPVVVVELFTSQGCSSCPAADAFLGELAKRPGILALSFHVDYWDYIGWKDPYAQRAFAKRQRAYSRSLSQRYVYTPQMVIDGRLQEVGSEREAVERLIAEAIRSVSERPAIRVTGSGAEQQVEIEGPASSPPATVWLACYDRSRSTDIRRGENGGRRLTNYNIVREWRRLGSTAGTLTRLPMPVGPDTPGEAAAILVQEGDTGPILAAKSFALPGR